MPIVLNTTIPLPNLKVYTSISLLLVSSSMYYAFNATNDPNWKLDTNATVFQSRGSTTLEDLLSIQDELSDKESIIDNFNNLQDTILAAIRASSREKEEIDALESGLKTEVDADIDTHHLSNQLEPQSSSLEDSESISDHRMLSIEAEPALENDLLFKTVNKNKDALADMSNHHQSDHQHYHEHSQDMRTFSTRLRDIAAFMLQEPICIWVSGVFINCYILFFIYCL